MVHDWPLLLPGCKWINALIIIDVVLNTERKTSNWNDTNTNTIIQIMQSSLLWICNTVRKTSNWKKTRGNKSCRRHCRFHFFFKILFNIVCLCQIIAILFVASESFPNFFLILFVAPSSLVCLLFVSPIKILFEIVCGIGDYQSLHKCLPTKVLFDIVSDTKFSLVFVSQIKVLLKIVCDMGDYSKTWWLALVSCPGLQKHPGLTISNQLIK